MPRLEFTKSVKQASYKRSGGICECHRVPQLRRPEGCGVKLIDNGIFFEHIWPVEVSQDNSIDNCAVLTRNCWREKTFQFDQGYVKKSNRVRDRARGIKKKSKFACSRDWQFKKKIDGTVVPR